MSLTSALSNAYSGLVATARQADLVSGNIANALTEGFARREIALASSDIGGRGTGVRVSGIVRVADARATYERRRTEAEEGSASALGSSARVTADSVGEPGADGALPTLARAFETALQRAAETPESTGVQGGLLNAARSYALALNAASAETRRGRETADAAIARDVATVNEALARIVTLNREIRGLSETGDDFTALEDQRQLLIDEVNRIVPVRTARRGGEEIALYTPGGAVLVEGSAATLGFTATHTITADMTLGSGALSGLTLNGTAVPAGSGSGRLDGGTLGAAFARRDVTLPAADARLDGLARDLADRFEAVNTDAGGAGLFTDAGAAVTATTPAGLAGRLAVNAAVDPDQGGALWRLRDGLAAATQGDAGNGTLLAALSDAFAALQPAPAGSGLSGSYDAASLAEEVAALFQSEAAEAEERAAFATGAASAKRDAELGIVGVDTDAEMQKLLRVEQAYAANARVIETVDFLMRRLLEI